MEIFRSLGLAVSYEKTVSTQLVRKDWIDGVAQLRISSYSAKVPDIKIQRSHGMNDKPVRLGELATATVDESLAILVPGVVPVEKHFVAMDLWSNLDGTWKLTDRTYQSDAYPVSPHLTFPAQ